MQITIHLSEEATRSSAGKQWPVMPKALERALQELGVHARPLHPDVDDPELARQYYVEVPDERAEEVRERVQSLESVEAAYVKPPDSPPSF